MRKIAIFLAFSTLVNPILALSSQNCITNGSRNDGFGGQFQTIIYSVIYAELNDKQFVYTPFQSMEHNYDGDPQFIEKKEALIGFLDNFEVNDGCCSPLSPIEAVMFFERNLTRCTESQSLSRIKKIFRQNKNKNDYFDDLHLHIAVHIRRSNPHDSRKEGPDIPDSFYLNIIDKLQEIYSDRFPQIHIFSQGDIRLFREIYKGDNIVFHLDESIEATFSSLVFADILVTSASSLSYTAGILSEGTVYYIPFWHPQLAPWISCGDWSVAGSNR